MNLRNLSTFILFVSFTIQATGQPVPKKPRDDKENMPADTPENYRWWNLLHYTINITPDYNSKFVSGTNAIQFRALQIGHAMQIDLQRPMVIKAIKWKSTSLVFKRDGDSYLVNFPRVIKKGETQTVIVQFEGNPHVANRPPWDNGWIWATDKKGRPWMSIACEGSGAAIWLPCKNLLYDEPDSGVSFSITVPDTLVAVANGRIQRRLMNKKGTATYTWNVVNPINHYNIIPYIGKYVTWHENYAGLKGNLDCDYWVLDYNKVKAKKHFKQTDTMLNCFESWLGPYPFYEDSYKLVEAPMLGMEHQSAIAYGNEFENGYSGKNLSGTEWGLKWDFILIHESGHEWFGNSITSNGGGDSWIHEGFTKYLETLYTDYLYGKEAGNDYAIGIWKRIKNDEPVLGTGTSDAYNKGSAMLHMIRQIIGDISFKEMLQGLNKRFYHQTVNTSQLLDFINQITQHDFTRVINQYLGTTQIPVLEYFVEGTVFKYRWTNCVEHFDMPLKISFNSQDFEFIYPGVDWKEIPVKQPGPVTLTVDRNFYVGVKRKKVVRHFLI